MTRFFRIEMDIHTTYICCHCLPAIDRALRNVAEAFALEIKYTPDRAITPTQYSFGTTCAFCERLLTPRRNSRIADKFEASQVDPLRGRI